MSAGTQIEVLKTNGEKKREKAHEQRARHQLGAGGTQSLWRALQLGAAKSGAEI